MRVLILSHNYPNSVQITKGIFVSEQVRFLAEKCEIKVIAPIPYAPPFKFFKRWYSNRLIDEVEIYENIEIYHPRYILFPKKILYSFAGFFMYFGINRTVKKMIKNWDFDIIHAHFSFPDGFAGMKISNKYHKTLITTEHLGSFDEMMKHKFWFKATKSVFEKSNKVIVVSSHLRKLIESMRIKSSKVSVIPNGVDTNKFSCVNSKLQSKCNLIAIGNFKPVKRFMILLKAINLIIKRGYNVELTLVGDGILFDKYSDYIDDNDLKGFITLPGYVQHEKLVKYFKNSHICISSSYKESFGVTIIEALASGLPVVVTNSGGPDKYVSDISGIIVEKDNVDALVEGIISLMKNYSKYSQKQIREYCVNNFDYNFLINKIINIYKKAIDEKQ